MNYPCGLIRDLIPLFIDDVCNEESRKAVESHIEQCLECRRYMEEMKGENHLVDNNINHREDLQMADSLKEVKKRLNKKNKKIIACCVAAVIVALSGYHLLFSMSVKDVPIDEVSVEVEVYPIKELINTENFDEEATHISSAEDDESDYYTIVIPSLDSKIQVTEDVLDSNEYISVTSWSSDYFLRRIRYIGYEEMIEKGYEADENTVYVSSIKTTLLNNKAEEYNHITTSLDFKKIERIVYVNDDGTQTVLWE